MNAPSLLRSHPGSLACVVVSAALVATTGVAVLRAQPVEPPRQNLQLWLKADAGVTADAGGVVSAWADQSGQANHAAQPNASQAPKLVENVLNGKPVLRFEGGTRYLDVPNSPSVSFVDDLSTFFVIKLADQAGYRAVWSKVLGNKPRPTDFYFLPDSNIPRLYRGNASQWLSADGAAAVPSGVFAVMGFDVAGNAIAHYFNDQINGRGTIALNAPAEDSGLPLRIGSRDDLVTQFKGDLAELLLYDVALSDSERGQVLEYLRNKYALPFNQPPTVAITAPAPNTSVEAPATVSMAVTASDTDGQVTRVDFLANGVLVASATEPPYQLNLELMTPGTARLTAVAYDNGPLGGLRSTSAPVVVTATGTAPTAPVTGRLQLWLKADAGVTTAPGDAVEAWSDQSGQNNHASQWDPAAAPVLVQDAINGKPAVRFTDAPQYLDVASAPSIALAGDVTTFAVLAVEDFATFRGIWAKTVGNRAEPNDYYLAAGTGIATLYRANTGTAAAQGVTSTFAVPTGQPVVVGFDIAGQAVTHYLNAQADRPGSITLTPEDGGLSLRIGSRDDLATQMKGDLAELLIYDKALTAEERATVLNYLGARYGIAYVRLGNQAPVVNLTSPTDGATLALPATATIVANATDSDDTVARVELLANGLPLATLTNSPYQLAVDFLSPGQVQLTAVATDSWGARGTSAPVTVQITGSAPATPPSGDLNLWLKADAGVTTGAGNAVTAWADQSGQGNDAYQWDPAAAPLLVAGAVNGKPALRFAAAPQYLEVADSPTATVTGDLTTFYVVKFDDFGTYRAVWAQTFGNLARPFDCWFAPGTGVPNAFRGGAAGYGAVAGTAGVPAGHYAIVGLDASGTTLTHYLNDQPNGSGTITAVPEGASVPLRIGTRDDQVTQMKGDIAEVLLYARALSASERNNLVLYLAGKYGIPLLRIANTVPTVELVSPTPGTSVAAPGTLVLKANASDPDGTIQEVQFTANDVLIASVPTAPYELAVELRTPGVVTLRAVAVDNWGARGLSAPVTLAITGSGPAAPPTAGLQLWLKADAGVTAAGGAVTTWADQSGNRNDAVQPDGGSAPALVNNAVNGKPAVRFDGELRYLDVASSPSVAITADVTSFYVAKFDDFEDTRTIWTKCVGNQPRPRDYWVAAGTGIPTVSRGTPDGNAPVAAASGLPAGQYVVAGFQVEVAQVTHFLFDQSIGGGVHGYGAVDDGGPLRIGLRDDFVNQMKGDLSELLIYNRALSAEDRDLLVTYLASKYGVPLLRPATAQPVLSIQRQTDGMVVITWPEGLTGYTPESTDNLGTPNWTPVNGALNNRLIVAPTEAMKYYRLRK